MRARYDRSNTRVSSDTFNGIFPNDAAIVRLIGAVLLEQNDEWQLQQRYMQVEAMAEMVAAASAADPRQIPCAA